MTTLAWTSVLQSLENLTSNSDKQISRQDYEIFCKEFLFDRLQEITFGEAFCKRFGLNDTFLRRLSDETAKYHIELLGYIK